MTNQQHDDCDAAIAEYIRQSKFRYCVRDTIQAFGIVVGVVIVSLLIWWGIITVLHHI